MWMAFPRDFCWGYSCSTAGSLWSVGVGIERRFRNALHYYKYLGIHVIWRLSRFGLWRSECVIHVRRGPSIHIKTDLSCLQPLMCLSCTLNWEVDTTFQRQTIALWNLYCYTKNDKMNMDWHKGELLGLGRRVLTRAGYDEVARWFSTRLSAHHSACWD